MSPAPRQRLMPAATSMKKSKPREAKVTTNLEKKTRQKIAKMTTSDGNGAADLLKDLKYFGKLKKCHVRVARLGKKTLGKISKKKDKPQRKVRATLVRAGPIIKKPEKRGRSKNVPEKRVRPRKVSEEKPPKSEVQPTITENETPEKRGRKRKAVKSPENNKRNKEEKKKRQIYIRLPFLETAKLKSLNKDLIEKNYNKKAPPIKRLGKTYLTEKFGGKYFRCHVKVMRYRSPNEPAPKKKDKFNRKSVSFVETVEVFGESDDDQSQVINSPRASTPAQENGNSSTDSITVSPSKRKLKNTESPRSEHIRKSDEKVPHVKPFNTPSSKAKQNGDNATEKAVQEPPTAPDVEDAYDDESLNVDATEHEVLPEDERVEEEEEEEEEEDKIKGRESEKEEENEDEEKEEEEEEEEEDEEKEGEEDDEEREEEKEDEEEEEKEEEISNKLDETAPVTESESVHISDAEDGTEDKCVEEEEDDDVTSIKDGENHLGKGSEDDAVESSSDKDEQQQGTSHEHREDDGEASNDLSGDQQRNAGNNNNSNHIELSSSSDHDSNIFQDTLSVNQGPDLFLLDEQGKDFSLQLSNNSEMSALCTKSDQINDPESDSVLSNLNNIDSLLDETSDRPAQQTKFSLNTFFKSLKTKIITQRTESIPPTKTGSQCTEHEGDQTLRDELTIQ